jgi:hypothetical protein
MGPRIHIFVTQRARDEAVDRIMAAILDTHQLRPLDRQEPNGGHSLFPVPLPPLLGTAEPPGRPREDESTRRPERHGLLPFERFLLVCMAVLAAVIVAGNLWQHAG